MPENQRLPCNAFCDLVIPYAVLRYYKWLLTTSMRAAFTICMRKAYGRLWPLMASMPITLLTVLHMAADDIYASSVHDLYAKSLWPLMASMPITLLTVLHMAADDIYASSVHDLYAKSLWPLMASMPITLIVYVRIANECSRHLCRYR